MTKAKQPAHIPKKYTEEEARAVAEKFRLAREEVEEVARSGHFHSFAEVRSKIGTHRGDWDRSQRAELVRLLQKTDKDSGAKKKKKKPTAKPTPTPKTTPPAPIKTPTPTPTPAATPPAPIQTPKK